VYDVSEEFNSIKSACEEEEAERRALGGQSVVVKAFLDAPVRRAILIGCSLQLFQQLTGINTVM